MVEAPRIHPFMATTTPLRAKAKGQAQKESVLSLATGFYFEHEADGKWASIVMYHGPSKTYVPVDVYERIVAEDQERDVSEDT